MRFSDGWEVVHIVLSHGQVYVTKYGRQLVNGERAASSYETGVLEPAVLGKLAQGVAKMHSSLARPVPTEMAASIPRRTKAVIELFSDGNEARALSRPPSREDGLDEVVHDYPNLSSRRSNYKYHEDRIPKELRDSAEARQQLYLPAAWKDAEMLGQAILNVLHYADIPHTKKQKSLFDPEQLSRPVKLHRAATDGLVNVLPKNNRSGRDYDIRDDDGATPLMLAAANGHVDFAARLIHLGADINLHDVRGRTSLNYAAAAGSNDVVQLLLNQGASPAIVDELGRSPLHVAAANGHSDAIRELITGGADPNLQDFAYHSTPLHLAARVNHPRVIATLKEHGADIDAVNEAERTPLHVAAAYGHVPMVETLLNAGADPNRRDTDGETPLFRASFFQHSDCLELLLQAGADSSASDKHGRTALHVAASMNRDVATRLLIDGGADIEATDAEGLTPFDLALVNIHCHYVLGHYEEHNAEAIEVLLRRGASVDPSRIPSLERQIYWHGPMLSKILSIGCAYLASKMPWMPKPHPEGPFDRMATSDLVFRNYLIDEAIDKGMNELLEQLLADDIGMNELWQGGVGEMFGATRANNQTAVRILVENGVDINVYSDYSLAAHLLEVFDKGKRGRLNPDKPWLRYSQHKLPIDWAIQSGAFDVVRTLLELGAEPPLSFEDVYGRLQDESPKGIRTGHPLSATQGRHFDKMVDLFQELGIEIINEENRKRLSKAKAGP